MKVRRLWPNSCSVLQLSLAIVLLSSRNVLRCATHKTYSDQCQCDLESNSSAQARYYCGGELNRANSTSDCSANILYMCNRNNRMAIAIAKCPKKNFTNCNDSFSSRNDCLRSMKCACRGSKFNRNQIHCGQMLHGSDCVSSTLYQCRRIGSALPLENCPHGCRKGKCVNKIVEVDLDTTIETHRTPDADSGGTNSTNSGTDSSENNSTTVSADIVPEDSGEHEVEFVTFAPLQVVPIFNP